MQPIASLIPMRYKSLGFREQGAGSREQGAGSREQGAGSREQRIWEEGSRKWEEGKNNVYLIAMINAIFGKSQTLHTFSSNRCSL